VGVVDGVGEVEEDAVALDMCATAGLDTPVDVSVNAGVVLDIAVDTDAVVLFGADCMSLTLPPIRSKIEACGWGDCGSSMSWRPL
jgi:hypothetical protein